MGESTAKTNRRERKGRKGFLYFSAYPTVSAIKNLFVTTYPVGLWTT